MRIILVSLLFVPLLSFAQKEKGRVIRGTRIFQKKEKVEERSLENLNFNNAFENEADFIFEEEPRLRFKSDFEPEEKSIFVPNQNGELNSTAIRIEPIKELNTTANEDTSSIDEGELLIVEIEEEARFPGSDKMVTIASYFSVWDTKTVNPYGISAREFNDVVPIKLYDLSMGRYWSPPLNENPITSQFGWRRRRWHLGTDLDLETGDPVYSTFDGIIRVAGTHSGWGRTVVVRHYNGLETLYGHLSRINFEENTLVKAGDEIGKGGNTGRSSGSHLHLEVRFEGNAFDPLNIFRFSREKTEIVGQDFVISRNLWNYLRGGSSRVEVNMNAYETDEETEEVETEEDPIPQEVTTKVWYRVKPGDNLTKIAKNYNTTVAEICQLNKISSYKKLYVGLRLRVK